MAGADKGEVGQAVLRRRRDHRARRLDYSSSEAGRSRVEQGGVASTRKCLSMSRLPPRVLPLIALAALAAVAPSAANLGDRKHALDDRVAGLQSRIAAAREQERALSDQVDTVTGRIRSLEARVGDVSSRLTTLQADLALHRTRLRKIDALYRLQTRQLQSLEREYHLALHRLSARLVEIYESGEPTALELLMNARSLADALDQVDYAGRVGTLDKQVASEVAVAKARARRARQQTRRLRRSVAAETRVIGYRRDQAESIRNGLLASRSELAATRERKQHVLAGLAEQERAWTDEANALSAASAQVEAQIQAAQAAEAAPTTTASSGTPAAAPSASGLIWPVGGPITSPFGMRWGSLHPGIDIAAASGTPIEAAASGRVIVAAYSGGYGNLVVIDHGNGLATAYAHQSQIAVGVGETVRQGQTIGYVGSTGFSTGPHLHFEVRVNGAPADPMGYL